MKCYAVIATLLLTGPGCMSLGATGPAQFVRSCVTALDQSMPNRPLAEHHSYCRCIAQTAVSLHVNEDEFAAEIARLRRDPAGASTGRIREAANQCFDDIVRRNQ